MNLPIGGLGDHNKTSEFGHGFCGKKYNMMWSCSYCIGKKGQGHVCGGPSCERRPSLGRCKFLLSFVFCFLSGVVG